MKNHTHQLKWLAVACCFLPLSLLARTEAKPVTQNKPMCFIENAGQIIDQHGKQRKDIDYKLSAPGMNIFIGNGQIHYQWNKVVSSSQFAVAPGDGEFSRVNNDKQVPIRVETYRIDVTLVGANLNTPAIPEEIQQYTECYYLPQFGEEGRLVHTYNTIVYKNIYPNIDWVLYTKNGTLKYDLIVHPGGNPKHIQLKYEGATGLALKDGAITATTPLGSVTEQVPFTYDQQTKQTIASKFVLNGNILSFDIANHEGTAIIDPTLIWATYYGGGSSDISNAVASDAAGNVSIAGYTNSTTNIATTGAYQAALAGQQDAFIAQFDKYGTRLFGTYYGGSGDELCMGQCKDAAGNIFITGRTMSNNMPVTPGAHQLQKNSTQDGFVAKFSSTGILVWSTYYGGDSTDQCNNITCDIAGNVYIGGYTSSVTNIATPGSYKSSLSMSTPSQDGFLVKLNSNGVRQWGTYFGDIANDAIEYLACDPQGNIYIYGETSSTTNIATPGAHQSTLISSPAAFLAKFNPAGNRLWGTYYGQSIVWPGGVACDISGNVYIAGTTNSTSGIATSGSYQSVISATTTTDGFLVKFNANGVRQWGTYYGNVLEDDVNGVATGAPDRVYISGVTRNSSGIATINGYQTVLAGLSDAFIAEFDGTGTRQWATYFGGTGAENYSSRAVGSFICFNNGYLFITGLTTTTGPGIATSGAHQTSHNGGIYEGYLAGFFIDTMVQIVQPFTDTVFCAGDSFKLAYTVSTPFNPGNVFTAQLSDASGSFTTPVNIGTKTISTSDTIKCAIPPGTTAGSNYRIRIVAGSPVRTSVDNGINIRVKPLPANINATNNSPLCVGSTLNLSVTTSTAGTITYSWTGPGSFNSALQNPSITNVATTQAGDYIVTVTSQGCTAKDTTTVVVKIIPATPVVGNNSPICPDSTLKLTAASTTTGVTYAWTGPASFNSAQQNPSISNASAANTGSYLVTATLNGCTSPAATTNAVVYNSTPTPVANSNAPICEGAGMNLTAGTITGATYEWTGPKGFTSNQQNPIINPAFAFHSGDYIVKAILNGCYSQPDTAVVTINSVSSVGAYASPNDTVCTGMITTFVAYPFNAGSSPQFQWFKNGVAVPGATGTVYNTTNLVTGDSLYCRMIAAGVCNVPLTLFTNGIKMVVHSVVVVPSVTITSNPAQPIPGQPAVFYASHVNGGPFPAYQWRRDGKNVPGAVFANWNVNDMHPYEKISCVLTSSDSCAQPRTDTSNEIVGNFSVHIGSLNSMDEVSLYPNPNNGNFTLKTIQKGILQVYILQGQLVNSYEITEHETYISLPASLTPGVYMGRFTDGNNKITILKIDYQR